MNILFIYICLISKCWVYLELPFKRKIILVIVVTANAKYHKDSLGGRETTLVLVTQHASF